MKSLKLSAIALTSVLLLASASAYAELKIAVIDVQAIFQSLPQAAAIQQTITDEFKDEIEAVRQLEGDLQFYMEKQRRDAATMSQEDVSQLEQQILSMRDEYAAKAQPLQQEIQRRQSEERNRLLALIQQGLDKVAAAGQYDFVLNSNAVAFAKDNYNISQQVVDEIVKTQN